MTVIIAFLTVLGAVAVWWLSRQRLAAKPWLEASPAGSFPDREAVAWPAAKLGLCMFLAVAGSLFAVLISAYSLRMRAADWSSLPGTGLLWINTWLLVLSSLALQWAVVAVQRRDTTRAAAGLGVGGVSALLFLGGQLLVWRQLNAGGFYAESHPASAFFYLITAIHGLHLAGGMLALGRVGARVSMADGDAENVRLSVELCALYWHFLLVVWLLVCGILVLGPWAEWLYAICFGT